MKQLVPVIPVTILFLGCSDREAQRVGTVDGDLTWEVEFSDGDRCTYTRSFSGVEDRSSPWLCPECDVVWRAERVGFEGEDCYARLGVPEPSDVEWLGWGEGQLFRSPTLHARLFGTGTARLVDDALEVSHEFQEETGAGTVTLRISGRLDMGRGQGDPMHGYQPPDEYACGWERSDPPAYEGDWTLERGRTVPDGWFHDRCGDPVRLHDLEGRYVVVDIAAADCPPCVEMARTERQFVQQMRDEGVDVEVVTLLAPSLGAVLDPTPRKLLDDWTQTFGIQAPVLADRGWGLFVAGAAVPSFGYPTSVVIGPDLTVLTVTVGFSDWAPFADLIREHAGR